MATFQSNPGGDVLYNPPMGKFTCCSIVARNYLPRARVLAKSLSRHHPEVALWVLVIDDESIGLPGMSRFRSFRSVTSDSGTSSDGRWPPTTPSSSSRRP